jgi:outer membrane biosynthesis protein TonB
LEYVEGLVELEFDVDRLGKPYNISVTNSNTVNADASNKAIQIVKEGPAWIADKKKKKAKVTIKF